MYRAFLMAIKTLSTKSSKDKFFLFLGGHNTVSCESALNYCLSCKL